MGFIYSLKDPNINTVRYIGKTINPIKNRLRSHIYNAKKSGKKNKLSNLSVALNYKTKCRIKGYEVRWENEQFKKEKKRKCVIKYNEKESIEYESIKLAAYINKVNRSCIYYYLNSGTKHQGFYWKLKNG